MAGGHKDYSGTPLWRKLGIREGSRVVAVGAPGDFRERLAALAPLPAGVRISARVTAEIDVAVLFVTRRAELERRFATLADRLRPGGGLWVAWPKKASSVATDLTFGDVQGHGLAAGLVDNKSASVDDVFQGCRFVSRRKDRPR